MPRGTRGRGRAYVLADVLAAAAGAVLLLAAAQIYLHFWRMGTGGLASVEAVQGASVLQERLARDAASAAGVQVVGGGAGLELTMPDGRTVTYTYLDGRVLRDGVALVRGLTGGTFWADLSGARPLVGADLLVPGARFRTAAAVGPP